MDPRLIGFLSMQLWTLPLLLVCAAGLATGLVQRRLGARARQGAIGFGLLLLAQLSGVLQNYLMTFVYEPGNLSQFATLSLNFGLGRLALQLAGLVTLMFAAFSRDQAVE